MKWWSVLKHYDKRKKSFFWHESHIFVLRKIYFKQMKIIAVYTQLKQLRNKAWKKFRPERESNPWSHLLHLRVYNELTIIQLPVGLIAQLVRALHRYSQRSWVRFPFRPEFFSGLISQLLKLSIYCDDLHLLKMYFPQYKYMTFMYSYHKLLNLKQRKKNVNCLLQSTS